MPRIRLKIQHLAHGSCSYDSHSLDIKKKTKKQEPLLKENTHTHARTQFYLGLTKKTRRQVSAHTLEKKFHVELLGPDTKQNLNAAHHP